MIQQQMVPHILVLHPQSLVLSLMHSLSLYLLADGHNQQFGNGAKVVVVCGGELKRGGLISPHISLSPMHSWRST